MCYLSISSYQICPFCWPRGASRHTPSILANVMGYSWQKWIPQGISRCGWPRKSLTTNWKVTMVTSPWWRQIDSTLLLFLLEIISKWRTLELNFFCRKVFSYQNVTATVPILFVYLFIANFVASQMNELRHDHLNLSESLRKLASLIVASSQCLRSAQLLALQRRKDHIRDAT